MNTREILDNLLEVISSVRNFEDRPDYRIIRENVWNAIVEIAEIKCDKGFSYKILEYVEDLLEQADAEKGSNYDEIVDFLLNTKIETVSK